jgi:HK97 family phage portal protein
MRTVPLIPRGELGAVAHGAAESLARDEGWLVRVVGGGRTKAGPPVSEWTALNLPVVYACVNRIANPLARVSLRIYRKRADGSSELVTDPREHPLARALGTRPNEFMSSRTLRKAVQSGALLWGNGYAEIERNGRGQAVGLWPLLSDRTRPAKRAGRVVYETNIDGRTVEIDGDDVVHIMDQSHDGYVGRSPIWHARQAVGMGLAMEEFGAKFFANDAKSGGFLMHPGRLSDTARGNLGRSVPASPDSPAAPLERQGGLDNAHRVKVLEEGMKFVTTTIPPEDAQFLGSREFQIAEIARIYDVPLVLLQSHEKSTSWGSGIEQLMIGFVRQTIDPWADAWEQELNYKLFTEAEQAAGFYVKFNLNTLMRGDAAARATLYRELFGVGAMSPNMIAALEEFESAGPAGDRRFVPANFVPLDDAGEQDGAEAPSPRPALPPVDPADDDPPAEDEDAP